MSLTIKAAVLARTAPKQWDEFLAALAVYANERKDDCIRSPIEVLAVAQGRAQQCAVLLTLLANALKDADKSARS